MYNTKQQENAGDNPVVSLHVANNKMAGRPRTKVERKISGRTFHAIFEDCACGHRRNGTVCGARPGAGQAGGNQGRHHDIPVRPGLRLRRAGQGRRRDDRRGSQQEGRHRRRAGEAVVRR